MTTGSSTCEKEGGGEKNETTTTTEEKKTTEKKTWPTPESRLRIREFEVSAKLGQGSFGTVVLARRRDRWFAVKVIPKRKMRRGDAKRVRTEAWALGRLRHPLIVRLEFAFHDKAHVYLGLEALAGNLSTALERHGELSARECAFYVTELALALEFVHSRGFIYRDLKPSNILLDRRGHACLGDFGLAADVSRTKGRARTFCGTAAYMAPEQFLSRHTHSSSYTSAVDWYALGVVLTQCLAGSKMLDEVFETEDYEGMAEAFRAGAHLKPLSQDVPARAADLRNRLCCVAVSARVQGGPELRRHPFFSLSSEESGPVPSCATGGTCTKPWPWDAHLLKQSTLGPLRCVVDLGVRLDDADRRAGPDASWRKAGGDVLANELAELDRSFVHVGLSERENNHDHTLPNGHSESYYDDDDDCTVGRFDNDVLSGGESVDLKKPRSNRLVDLSGTRAVACADNKLNPEQHTPPSNKEEPASGPTACAGGVFADAKLVGDSQASRCVVSPDERLDERLDDRLDERLDDDRLDRDDDLDDDLELERASTVQVQVPLDGDLADRDGLSDGGTLVPDPPTEARPDGDSGVVGVSPRSSRPRRSGPFTGLLLDPLACPITGHTLVDPVVCDDGHTYERDALFRYLEKHGPRSPSTGNPLDPAAIFPNLALRRILAQLRRGGPPPQSWHSSSLS